MRLFGSPQDVVGWSFPVFEPVHDVSHSAFFQAACQVLLPLCRLLEFVYCFDNALAVEFLPVPDLFAAPGRWPAGGL